MRAHLRNRAHSTSINAVPPPKDSSDYSLEMEKAAASILYRSPIPSQAGHPIYILNTAALPDAQDVEFDTLLPYVLARLPGEDQLVNGAEYEVIVFAGGPADGPGTVKRSRPSWSWFVQAYHVLSRAMRKRIQKLYIVHERTWVRMLVEMFSTIVSPKFRKKIVHASTLSSLALRIPIEDLLIPPAAYHYDRKLSPDIFVPYASGKRAFSARCPLPRSPNGHSRLPRVLRETTSFILMDGNIRTEGIFRIPPNLRTKEILREAYDRGQKFIVWREGQNILPLPAYEGSENTEAIVRELDIHDTYGLHLAAGVCKFWYSELRDPLIPPRCYQDLKRLFGSSDEPPSLDRLTDLLSLQSEWSILPPVSRKILTRHLLPMLSAIAAQQEVNKMTPENLAVCFAACLIRGPDQLEDAKIASLLRRILTYAVTMWEPELREACNVDSDAFEKDLRPPTCIEDYEDPLDEADMPTKRTAPAVEFEQDEQQRIGIILKDNEETPDLSTMSIGIQKPPEAHRELETAQFAAPALPPRPSSSGQEKPESSSQDPNLKRKPAPPLVVPPRYSAIAANHVDVSESPSTYTAVADGFAPPMATNRSALSEPADLSPVVVSPVYTINGTNSQVKRKPVTPKTSTDDK